MFICATSFLILATIASRFDCILPRRLRAKANPAQLSRFWFEVQTSLPPSAPKVEEMPERFRQRRGCAREVVYVRRTSLSGRVRGAGYLSSGWKDLQTHCEVFFLACRKTARVDQLPEPIFTPRPKPKCPTIHREASARHPLREVTEICARLAAARQRSGEYALSRASYRRHQFAFGRDADARITGLTNSDADSSRFWPHTNRAGKSQPSFDNVSPRLSGNAFVDNTPPAPPLTEEVAAAPLRVTEASRLLTVKGCIPKSRVRFCGSTPTTPL